MSRVRENRTHGSRRRELETEHPVMVTAVQRPAGETRGKVAAGPDAGKCHRASSRPYTKGEPVIRDVTVIRVDTRTKKDISGRMRSPR